MGCMIDQNQAQPPTHLAFADEANHNTGRFRAVASVTAKSADATAIRAELAQHLEESGVREFKWAKLRTAQYRFAALRLLDSAIGAAVARRMRVDVLLWDVEDSRHKVLGRSDVRNLRRMYYFLFKNVLLSRWPRKAAWAFYPDENSAVDWNSIGFYLETVVDYGSGELLGELDIREIAQTRSECEPMIQMCDLFAGLAVFSRASYERFAQWSAACCSEDTASFAASNADRERFEVVRQFNDRCKQRKLGVSLGRFRGLRSLNPRKPINFWWYEPQGNYDRAPIWK